MNDSQGAPACVPTSTRWPLERVLFALAGSMTLLSVALVALVSPWFLILTALVGLNQWLYVTVGACPASLFLRWVFNLRSVIYPRPERNTRFERVNGLAGLSAGQGAIEVEKSGGGGEHGDG